MKKTVLAIDIGGTNTSIALVNNSGEIIRRSIIRTQEFAVFEDFVDEIYSEAKKINTSHLEIQGIGIGAPNGNFHNGSIEYAPNLPWEGIILISDIFKSKFNLEVVVHNDANAAAIGEKKFGAAKEFSDFVVITLGTGLGTGIYSNNKLLLGAHGFAGELGHCVVEKNGRKCNCGRLGCLETYASVTGLKKTAFQLLKSGEYDSQLVAENMDDISGLQIEKLASKGDALSLDSFELTAKYLGEALANLSAILDPQAYILFGGLANANELILKPTKYYFQKNLLQIYDGKTQIIKSQLPNNDAALLGAAAGIFDFLKR
jgi:glucokinase